MNSRQRFLRTMDSESTDRASLFKEGIREGVLEMWREQGLETGKSLSDLFTYDKREEMALNLDAELDYVKLASSSNGLETIQKNLNPDDKQRLPKKFYENIKSWAQRSHPLMLEVHEGFFLTMGVGAWRSFSKFIYLLMDQPDFVRKVMQIHGEAAAKLTEKVLKEVDIDAVIFSEPIGGNHGALISLDMYREFVASSYIPIVDVLKRYGVKNIIVRTYANTLTILPALFEIGVNCLWACECNPTAMDYQRIRSDFGKEIRLIGGIDLDILRGNKDKIQFELESTILPLLEQGGYIPLADGRVREDISFESYAYYRKQLERIVQI
jgi:hypothetical protein